MPVVVEPVAALVEPPRQVVAVVALVGPQVARVRPGQVVLVARPPPDEPPVVQVVLARRVEPRRLRPEAARVVAEVAVVVVAVDLAPSSRATASPSSPGMH